MIDGTEWRIVVRHIPDSMTGSCQPTPREKKRKASWDGMTHFREHLIEIAPGQEPLDEADTLLHELEHATGVETEVCNEMNEHAFIGMMTPRIIRVLHDNPDLLKYFVRQLSQ